MELNAEQIIEILERFDFFQGQRAGRELWCSKPYEVQEQDIVNFSRDVALIKSYINELTEENERLRAENVDCQLGFRLLEDAFQRLEKINEQIESDTVREMQKRLEAVAYQSSDWSHGGHPRVVELDDIDQIAKEMLEGEQ